MKILGIGNAIIDVLCRVSDDFLIKNSLTKSTMKLIDQAEFNSLLSRLKIEETTSGGSVANSSACEAITMGSGLKIDLSHRHSRLTHRHTHETLC